MWTELALLCFAQLAQQPAARNLNADIEPIRKKHDLPALAAAIVTSKGLSAVGSTGVRKYGTDTPVTVNDQFHLGSDTKAMTATLLAMYVEEGKLGWDTTLAKALPDLAAKMDPAYRDVTIEQMLAHRAGFTAESWAAGKSFEDMQRLPGPPREQRRAYIAMILAEPPAVPPGTKYLYSNRSFAVAGAIAERIGNDSWEHLMQTRLFGPLGMTTCGFGAMGTPGKLDQPLQHEKHMPVEPGPLADNPPVIGPAGTVHCSVGDWGKFVQAHLSQTKLLRPETYRKLHTAPMGGTYGFGWGIVERAWAGSAPALTHAGSNTQNFAVVWIAPAKDFAVLVVTNEGGDAAAKACDETASLLIQNYLK